MSEIRSYGSGDVERVESDVVLDPGLREAVAYWMPVRQDGGNMWEALPESLVGDIALLGSVRSIPMTPNEQFGYDPIPLIRAREKTHTLRGSARILGTVNQVSVNGKRIPLWIRWVARQRVMFGDVCNPEFAWADGIRPDDYRPDEAMTRLFREFHGEHPYANKPMWLLHFEIFCDLMDELEGRWEL